MLFDVAELRISNVGSSSRFFIVFVGRRMSIPNRIIDSKADHFSSHDERESRIDQSNSVMKVLIAALFLECWLRT